MSLRSRLEPRLERGVADALTPSVWKGLETLEQLLVDWSRAVGLVGFSTQEERDVRYFGESLAALPHLPEHGSVVDIGSGGGAPALPLALARSSLAWTLVESKGRKATFLAEASFRLGLNATVVTGRYEDWAPEHALDTVMVRGVSLTSAMEEKMASELADSGSLLWFSSRARLEASRGALGLDASALVRLAPGPGWLLRVGRGALGAGSRA